LDLGKDDATILGGGGGRGAVGPGAF
jgi:hypothetical protein